MRKTLKYTFTSCLVVATAVPAVPGAATAATPRPRCRVSSPTIVEKLGISGIATQVNDSGDVAGSYTDAQYVQHAYVVRQGTAQPLYLPGLPQSTVDALSDGGYVLGHSSTDDGLRVPGFLWHDGTMTDLSEAVEPNFPHLPDVGVEPYVQGTMVNASGLVVGYESDRSLTYLVTWKGGVLTRIPTLGGSIPGNPGAVNDAGLVAVSARIPGDDFTHAAIWTGETLQDLGTLGGGNSMAADVNEAGHVVGISDTADGLSHPFLYRDGAMTDLGLPAGALWGTADYVNERDQVAGRWRGEDGMDNAFFWDSGRFTKLGPRTVTTGLNERGQVIVYQMGENYAPGVGFVWADGVRMDLPRLAPDLLTSADAINNRGEIVGSAYRPGITNTSVRWTVSCG